MAGFTSYLTHFTENPPWDNFRWDIIAEIHSMLHGLRTPNEGLNQRNLKIWADAADKICFGRT